MDDYDEIIRERKREKEERMKEAPIVQESDVSSIQEIFTLPDELLPEKNEAVIQAPFAETPLQQPTADLLPDEPLIQEPVDTEPATYLLEKEVQYMMKKKYKIRKFNYPVLAERFRNIVRKRIYPISLFTLLKLASLRYTPELFRNVKEEFEKDLSGIRVVRHGWGTFYISEKGTTDISKRTIQIKRLVKAQKLMAIDETTSTEKDESTSVHPPFLIMNEEELVIRQKHKKRVYNYHALAEHMKSIIRSKPYPLSLSKLLRFDSINLTYNTQLLANLRKEFEKDLSDIRIVKTRTGTFYVREDGSNGYHRHVPLR